MNRLHTSAVEVIGNTPLVDLSRFTGHHGLKGRILAKLEYLNPGFSKKDRVARQIIETAERTGALRQGQTVVELTSGNTGTGLAIVCSIKGNPFVAVMSRGNSMERARMMSALGAEVALVDQAPSSQPGQVSREDLQLVEERTQQIVKERNAFRTDQFHAWANSEAHEFGTATEAWEQSDGTITAFADFAGTGGSFSGCARFLKKRQPAIGCYVVEPVDAPFLAGGPIVRTSHKIQGGGYSRPLPLMDPLMVDGYLTVSDENACTRARELARLEGLFCGFSSGANAAAALQLLRRLEGDQTVLILLCDSGLKYLSTDLF